MDLFYHYITTPSKVPIEGALGEVRLVAHPKKANAMGDLAGESIPGVEIVQATSDAQGRLEYELASNAEVISPTNTVYEEIVTTSGRTSAPRFFRAVAGGGDITTMSTAPPADLPSQYPPLDGSVTLLKLAADVLEYINDIGEDAAVSYLGTVVNQAAMITLVGQRGDWCIRTDTPGTPEWRIIAEPSSSASNWLAIPAPAAPPIDPAANIGGSRTLGLGDHQSAPGNVVAGLLADLESEIERAITQENLKIPNLDRAAPLGVATLNLSGKLTESQRPVIEALLVPLTIGDGTVLTTADGTVIMVETPSIVDLISEETARAEAAESTLTTGLAGEVSRAEGQEALKIPLAQKGSPNGVAELDAFGKLVMAQVPAIAITNTSLVGSQAEMLALIAEVGDVAVRYDQLKTYILKTSPASVLANWEWLQTPTDVVTSVNGRFGPVTGLAEATDLIAAQADIDGHEAATSGAHEASAISVTPTTGVTSINTQAALAEIAAAAAATGGGAAAALAAHEADTTAIHGIADTTDLQLRSRSFFICKSADQIRNNDVNFVDDLELHYLLGANQTWGGCLVIVYTSSTVAKFRCKLSGPAGAGFTGAMNASRVATSGTVNTAPINERVLLGNSMACLGPGTGVDFYFRADWRVTTFSTPGPVTFQWAQNALDTTDTKVLIGSLFYGFKA